MGMAAGVGSIAPRALPRIAAALLITGSLAAADPVAAFADVVAAGGATSAEAATTAWRDRAALTRALARHRACAPPDQELATSPTLARHAQATWRDGHLYRSVLGALIDADGAAWRPLAATVTAYTPCREECDDDPGVTATGTDAFRTRGIAADPRALPYRTLVRVPGYGEAPVDDTGGAMRRDFARGEVHIDLRIPRRDERGRWRSEDECVRVAREIGVRHETVLVRMR